MQAVVDPRGQLINALLIYVVDVEQCCVVSDIMELAASISLVFLAIFEYPGGFPVVEDANNVLVFRIHDANVLQELLHL